MEDFPGQLPEAKPSEASEKKKKRRKRSGLRLPIAAVENDKQAEANEKTNSQAISLTEELTNLASKEKPKTEKSEDLAEELKQAVKAAKPQPIADEKAVMSEKEVSKTDEPEVVEDSEAYRPLPNYELEPVEFSGGEVIIHLNGDTPVEEREIPLTAAIEEPLEPGQVLFAHQPKQEQQADSETAELIDKPSEVLPVALPEEVVAPVAPEELVAEHVLRPRPEDVVYSSPASEEASGGPVLTSTHEQPASKQDVEDAIYYATRAGQNSGLLTGLLVGGGYEHFKHKRRERRAEKHFEKQNKRLEQERKDSAFGLQEQTTKQTETNQRFAVAERQYEALDRRLTNSERSENRFAPTVQPEKRPSLANNAEKQPPKPERLPQPDNEPLQLPADHRLESSAWHNIEVDSKTGKPVKDPTFRYGHEYYRERAQENTPTVQRNMAAGEVALVAAAGATSGTSPSNGPSASKVPPDIPDASTQRSPTSGSAAKTDSSSGSKSKPSSPTGPLWPWVVALVVIFICLVALLH